jgi:spore coat protein U-like protein
MHWSKAMTICCKRPRVLSLIRPAWRRKRSAASLRLIAAILLATAQQAWSATCTVNTRGVNFGSYDVFSNQNLDSTGNISVICNNATSYTIFLSPGGGSYASRSMASNVHRLSYNLYTDPSRTSVWGDGSGGTSIARRSAKTANHPVYGRIPARQNVYVGSYSDSITVTLNF